MLVRLWLLLVLSCNSKLGFAETFLNKLRESLRRLSFFIEKGFPPKAPTLFLWKRALHRKPLLLLYEKGFPPKAPTGIFIKKGLSAESPYIVFMKKGFPPKAPTVIFIKRAFRRKPLLLFLIKRAFHRKPLLFFIKIICKRRGRRWSTHQYLYIFFDVLNVFLANSLFAFFYHWLKHF